jgi:hypothetical protein
MNDFAEPYCRVQYSIKAYFNSISGHENMQYKQVLAIREAPTMALANIR